MRQGRGDRGSALIVAVILVIVVAGLAAAFLTVSLSQSASGSRASVAERAVATAEAGIDHALFRMNNWNANSPALAEDSLTLGDGTCVIAVNPPFTGQPDTYVLRAVATVAGMRRGVEAVVSPVTTRLFDHSAFGDRGVHLDSNARTDSYDSSLGSYASQAVNGPSSNRYARENGDVGSNEDVVGYSNVRVWGDARAGGQVRVPHGAVSGDTENGADAKELPPILVPPSAAAMPASARTIGDNANVTLPSGDYHWSAFRMHSNARLTIRGPARIVVDGPASASSNTRIHVDSTNGPVEFYFRGSVEFDSDTEIRALNRKPSDVKINIATDNSSANPSTWDGDPPVRIDSNAEVHALVYAPKAAMTLDSNGQLFGAIVGAKIRITSNFQIHYDEDAANSGEPGIYRVRSWRQFAGDKP